MSPRPVGRPAGPVTDEAGTLFIRNVPAEVLRDLDALKEQLQAGDELYGSVTRTGLALVLIKEALAARRAAAPAGKAKRAK